MVPKVYAVPWTLGFNAEDSTSMLHVNIYSGVKPNYPHRSAARNTIKHALNE